MFGYIEIVFRFQIRVQRVGVVISDVRNLYSKLRDPPAYFSCPYLP